MGRKRIRGRGGYDDAPWWGKVGHHALRGLGGVAGEFLGGPAGAGLGTAGGAALSKLMGWGRYRKRLRGLGQYGGSAGGNQLIADDTIQTPIQVNAGMTAEGDVYVTHREFIGNVIASVQLAAGATSGSSSFTVQDYAINPALSSSYPFLAQLAQNFALYEFQGLVYEYKPTSGEFGTTGTNGLGKLIMATQYDPDAPEYINSVAMENADYTTACKPSQHMLHGVETAPNQGAIGMRYTRAGPSPKDKILTDVGLFQIATEGIPMTGAAGTFVSSQIGELWVSYKVKLSRAQLYNSLLGQGTKMDIFLGYNAASAIIGSTSTVYSNSNSYYASTAPATYGFIPKLTNTIGCGITGTSSTACVIGFPQYLVTGTFLVYIWCNTAGGDAGLTANKLTVTNSNNMTVNTATGAYLGALIAPRVSAVAATGGSLSAACFVTVNGPNAQNNTNLGVTLDAANAVSGTYWQVYIIQVPSLSIV